MPALSLDFKPDVKMILPQVQWTPEMYWQANDAGCFEDLRVELVGGLLISMTDNPPHTKRSILAERALSALFPSDRWFVAREINLDLQSWAPRPDVMVARGPLVPTYDDRRPTADDVVMVVEVADSTYWYDHSEKIPRYLKAGIPNCWIVHLAMKRIEVFTASQPDGWTIYGVGDSVPVEVDGAVVGEILVGDILG
ncbi:Uma2 family endonuclease [Aquisphaera insulae]|uniref:Uma2 family endonuclease n=1 Tax=Aquisphaera insulae TaxID=2712864 RepID=UPI0013EB5CA7|nr:Uma2 family endonuclease [Aquisphaera insulae]